MSGTVSLCLNPEMGDVWEGEEGRCEGGEVRRGGVKEGKWTEKEQERHFLTCPNSHITRRGSYLLQQE